EKAAPAPAAAGIVRDRHDQRPGPLRQHGAANVIAATLTGRYPRAFRKDHHPAAVLQTLGALPAELADGRGDAAAIDGDRLENGKRPAEERYPEQFALEYPGL